MEAVKQGSACVGLRSDKFVVLVALKVRVRTRRPPRFHNP